MISPETVGRPFITATLHWRGFFSLVRYTFSHLHVLAIAPVREVFQRQIYFSGIQALGAVGLIALVAGIVITTQITSLVANPDVTARVLLWTVVRELGPLLSAIVVIARSSTAMASELAFMRIHGEMESLRRMGIDPLDYLVVPRVAGMTVSVITVTFYFQMIAIVSGLMFAAMVAPVSFMKSVASVVGLLSISEVLVSLLKAFVFGLLIAATSCFYGMHGQASVTDLPRAVMRAVLQNVLALFLFNAVITYVFFV